MIDVVCPHCGFHFQAEQPKPAPPTGKKKEAVDKLIEVWNAFAKENGLPQVRPSNKSLRAKIATRIGETGFLEDFPDALQTIKANSFFRGHNDTHWLADLEYATRSGKTEELAARHRAERDRNAKPGSTESTGSDASKRLLSRTRGDDPV